MRSKLEKMGLMWCREIIVRVVVKTTEQTKSATWKTQDGQFLARNNEWWQRNWKKKEIRPFRAQDGKEDHGEKNLISRSEENIRHWFFLIIQIMTLETKKKLFWSSESPWLTGIVQTMKMAGFSWLHRCQNIFLFKPKKYLKMKKI